MRTLRWSVAGVLAASALVVVARPAAAQEEASSSAEAPPPPPPPPPPGPPPPLPGGSMGVFGDSYMGGRFGAPPAPIAYGGGDAVHVHIQGSGQIFQETSNGWQVVCAVPCTTTVDPKISYKLGGFMLNDSHPFRVPVGSRSLELVARPVSSFDIGRSVTAWLVLGFAPAPIVTGALLATGTFDSSSGGHAGAADTILGGVLIGAGVIMTAVGIYMLAAPSGSTVETLSGDRIGRATTPHAPGGGVKWNASGFTF